MKLPTMKNWSKSPYLKREYEKLEQKSLFKKRIYIKEFKLFLNKRKNDDFKYESLNYILYQTLYKQI